MLPEMDVVETTMADLWATGITPEEHPVGLLRDTLRAAGIRSVADTATAEPGRRMHVAGLVTHRQRPETAKGTVFVTLEDDTGQVNVIVWPSVVESQRQPLLGSTLLTVYGQWQREGDVMHLVAMKMIDHSGLLQGLESRSRNFR